MSQRFHEKERRKLRRKWEKHLNEWNGTDLSQAEYCRNNGLAPSQFTYWKTKLSKVIKPNIQLVQVPATVFENVPEIKNPVNYDNYEMKVIISNQIQIEVKSDFSAASLKRLVSTLMEIS